MINNTTDDKYLPTDFLRHMEQFESMSANIAQIVSGYYRELVQNDVPSELAHDLTMAFHAIWWQIIVVADE